MRYGSEYFSFYYEKLLASFSMQTHTQIYIGVLKLVLSPSANHSSKKKRETQRESVTKSEREGGEINQNSVFRKKSKEVPFSYTKVSLELFLKRKAKGILHR